MGADDWRIRIDVVEEHARGLLDRLRAGEAFELARELEQRRLAVSRSDDAIFVYAGNRHDAEAARATVASLVQEHGIDATIGPVEHWLLNEERWDHESPEDTVEEDVLERGFAPWEVRIPCRSHHEARRLASQLAGEGYGVERRWSYVIAGVDSEQEARQLAARLHGEVEAGGELVWETMPGNPFAVFGGMGGAGTPF
jgi:hypothetical protein